MQFSIQRPTLPSAETHPEEKLYRRLDVNTWLRHLNQNGQVEEEYKLRKVPRRPSASLSFRKSTPAFFLFPAALSSIHRLPGPIFPCDSFQPSGFDGLQRTEMTQWQLHCDQGLFFQ